MAIETSYAPHRTAPQETMTFRQESSVLSNESDALESTSLFNVARTVLCGYLAVSIPLRIAFIPEFEVGMNDYKYATFVVIDFVSMILFMIDAFRNYRCNRRVLKHGVQISPVHEDGDYLVGSMVQSSEFVSNTVWRSPILRLVLSILACLPLEYTSLLMDGTGTGTESVNYWMLNRIVIILQLPNYIEDLADYFEARGLKNIGVQRAWKLFVAMALAGHWCCCGFFLTGKMEAIKGGDLTWPEDLDLFQTVVVQGEEGQALSRSIIMVDNVLNAYIQSLYWAYITMVSCIKYYAPFIILYAFHVATD